MSSHSPSPLDIIVRPLTRDDAPALHAAVRNSIASLSATFPWCHPGYGLADAQVRVAHCEAAWERRSEFPFGIFDARGQVLLGCVGLNQVDAAHRSANLGYWVGEAHRRRGVAVVAATQVARIGFHQLGLVRIEIVTTPGNHASQAVAEKLGATREAVARNRLVVRGVPTAAIVYSLVPEDLAALE
ncbi:MAG: GNAT family N-acetyltransferase [Xanthomonadales bacterium]|nr:GNAT family N-acetyltransferase [Xanthomonadales bacterium]